MLISAYSETDINHEIGRKILNDIEEGKYGEWFLSDYVFDETLTVMFSISKNKEEMAGLGKYLMKAFTLLTVSRIIFVDAFEIFSNKNKLSFTDSTIISMANKFGIEYIATFDKEIKKNFKNCISMPDITDIKKSRGIAKRVTTEDLRDESERFE